MDNSPLGADQKLQCCKYINNILTFLLDIYQLFSGLTSNLTSVFKEVSSEAIYARWIVNVQKYQEVIYLI